MRAFDKVQEIERWEKIKSEDKHDNDKTIVKNWSEDVVNKDFHVWTLFELRCCAIWMWARWEVAVSRERQALRSEVSFISICMTEWVLIDDRGCSILLQHWMICFDHCTSLSLWMVILHPTFFFIVSLQLFIILSMHYSSIWAWQILNIALYSTELWCLD